MRILIDTNCYSEIDGGDPETINRVQSATEVWVPLIVLAELYAGFELGSQKEQNEKQLESIREVAEFVRIPYSARRNSHEFRYPS